VQSLTRPATALPPTRLSHSLHMSQCRRFEPCIYLARLQPFICGRVPVFHQEVFIARRNNLAVTQLALASAIEHAGAARNGPRCRVPKTKRMRAMGLFTRDIKTMNDLFVHQLQDIYYAESL